MSSADKIEPLSDWRRAKLADVAEFVMGQAPPGNASNFKGNGTVFVKAGEFGVSRPVIREWTTKPLKFARSGDVLICVVGATAGKLNLGIDCAIGRSVAAIRPSKDVLERFLYLQLQPKVNELRAASTGSAQGVINKQMLANIEVLVPSVDEQQEIVAGVEKQFTRLEAGVAGLRRVQANLKRYRAAVLKAACEGKLVPTEAELARQEARSYETGAQLLERILTEQRQKWSGKGKHKEPAKPDTTNLPQLPCGWAWASLDEILLNITDGDHQPPPQTASGVPFLVIGNVRNREIDFTDTRFVSREYANGVDSFRKPARGDILYSLVGSYGIAVIVKTEKEFCIQRHIAVLRPHAFSPTAYLVHVLNSFFVYRQATAVATGTAQKTVPLAGLRKFAIPLPPLAEQQRIVGEVERRLSVVEKLETVVNANLQRPTRLRQSILQRAFEGKLVSPH